MQVDVVRVKGKETPVAIYEPLGRKGEVAGDVLARAQRFEAAFARYQARDWDGADEILAALAAAAPRPLYAVYLDRIAHFRANPPPADWDGVFVYTTK
jgi:adenylate cyclase